VDDDAFEGGHGEDYDLTLGTHTFIDTFEEQLVDRSAGDAVDVNVTFPEEYNHEALRGKPALFKVEVLEVKAKEFPEVDDEFAQDVSDFETLQAYRDDLAAQIRREKEEQANVAKRAAVAQKLVERAVMDVPEVMYTAKVEEMFYDMRQRLQQQGIPMETWLRYTGMSEAELRKSYEKPAKEDVEATLVLEAVAKPASGVSFEELKERITGERKKDMEAGLLNKMALDFVVDKAVAVEPDSITTATF
jgi:trigger factor